MVLVGIYRGLQISQRLQHQRAGAGHLYSPAVHALRKGWGLMTNTERMRIAKSPTRPGDVACIVLVFAVVGAFALVVAA